MQVITVFNNKGGVGKTTFLCNIAAHLAIHRDKKVLIVDADPQCNATLYLLPDEQIKGIYEKQNRPTVQAYLDPLRKQGTFLEQRITPIKSPRFKVSLIPGDPKLALSEDLLAEDWTSATHGAGRALLTTFVFYDLISKYHKFDYCFIDVGPSLGAINRSVLIASNYFVMPMSVDLFSLMAIQNISTALGDWKGKLNRGLQSYKENENEEYRIRNEAVRWRLKFAGYVTQQYTARTAQGIKRPVRAYERILSKAPNLIKKHLSEPFGIERANSFQLGEIPALHSLVPMSQSAHSPIFSLKGKDGVVGAHFSKVSEAESLYATISDRLIRNIGAER